MKTLKELKEERVALIDKMDGLIATAGKEQRDLSEKEDKEFDEYKAELAKLDKAIEREELVAKRKKDLAGEVPPVAHETRSMSDKEVKDLSKVSILRGLRLLAEGKQLDGIEAEVHAIASEEARNSGISIQGFAVPAFINSHKRGQSATGQTSAAGDQGGFTVATELNSLIEALWSKNFLSEVGATRLAGLQGNQKFMVQSSKPAASEMTEIESLTDTEFLFDDLDMAPNRRGVTIPVSKQILIQSSLDVQALVIDNIRKALDYKLNVDAATALLAAITGSNLVAIGTNGGAPTYDHMIDLEQTIAVADADRGNIKMLTNPKVRGKLKKTQKFASTNGDPVWEKDNTVNNYPAIVSNIISSTLTKGTAASVCSAIILGNFSDLYVGMWGGVDFIVDPYTLAKKHQVQVTANMFWDVEVARAASFAGIKDATTT